MHIYIDISELHRTRANTGIQRVVKEFLIRLVKNTQQFDYQIIAFNSKKRCFDILPNQDIEAFISNTIDFKFNTVDTLQINAIKDKSILFDIDSTWNTPLKRTYLYPILKRKECYILNFIYDLIPIKFPYFSHPNTIRNFATYFSAIYKYSDLIFFDSRSTEEDFLKLKTDLHIQKEIATTVIKLGSDFFSPISPIREPVNNQINELLNKKYVLFVGTLEPRKQQKLVLESFNDLMKKYHDLNLIFIGKKGWMIDDLIIMIENHPQKDKRLFLLSDIDDTKLSEFYKHAFIVTYLSEYEGFGLPIAESLKYGNITITSKNSSMYEVGRNFADYLLYNTKEELSELVSLYYSNEELYKQKKSYIKANFHPYTWDQAYNSIISVLNNFEYSINSLRINHKSKLQFIIISINYENLLGTINLIDKNISFLQEYIIITKTELVSKYKSIDSKHKITILDECIVLGKYFELFKKADHQTKNWLLRSQLVNLDVVETEFIMLDDDNRPIVPLNLDYYITPSGKYNAYYFYNLLEWNHHTTDYDKGQHVMKDVLDHNGLELLSYSSHQPQIINKALYKEVIEKFFDVGLKKPIDEWSIYFNYAASKYPMLFNKNVFETLCWPASATDWEYRYEPSCFSFENYYQHLYENGIFKRLTENSDINNKLKLKKLELNTYNSSRILNQQSIKIAAKNSMVHGVLAFKQSNFEFFIFNIPFVFAVIYKGFFRIKLNYKLLSHDNKLVNSIQLYYLLDGQTGHHIDIPTPNNGTIFSEDIIELPIFANNLKKGIYNLLFDIKIDSQPVYGTNSPYLSKLIICNSENEITKCLSNIAQTYNFNSEGIFSK